MRKTLLSALIALSFSSVSLAADYYVVVPLPGQVVTSAPDTSPPATPITVTLAPYTLPQATVGQPYSFNFGDVLSVLGDASFSPANVTWLVAGGVLPAGLTLGADGTVTGTPTEAMTAPVTLRAEYQTEAGEQSYTFDVQLVVSLQSATLPEALVGQAYSYDFNPLLQVQGDPAFDASQASWSVASGTLPAGLTLAADGTLTGTPTAAGTASVTLRADYKTAAGEQSYQVVTLDILVSLQTATLPAAEVAADYAGYDFKPLLSVTGDPNYAEANVTFSATGLPQGLTLSSAGVLTGTPAQKDPGASFEVVASYKGQDGQQVYTIVVNGMPLRVTQISATESHTCVVTTSGGAKCWGDNTYGQLGDGSTATQLTPVDVSGLTSGVTSISAGFSHVCAVTTSGGAKCWGDNSAGQLGDGGTESRLTPVDVSGLTSGVASVAAGTQYACALTTGGGAKCWGLNAVGQLGDGSMTNRLVPANVSGLTTGVSSLATGRAHTCAVVAGAAKCWGEAVHGQLGNNGSLPKSSPVSVVGLTTGVASVVTGSYSSCAVTTSGGAKCWGDNSAGQLGDGGTTRRLTPVDVTGLTSGVASLATGYRHTCAVTTSGGAKCWGLNTYGQLGDGTTTTRYGQANVNGLTSGVNAVVTSSYHSCAITTGGSVKCWGRNTSGQLGDGTTSRRLSPVDVTP